MLNLRQLNKADNPSLNSNADHFSRLTSPGLCLFAEVLGNIGEPLEHSSAEENANEGVPEAEVLNEGPDDPELGTSGDVGSGTACGRREDIEKVGDAI